MHNPLANTINSDTPVICVSNVPAIITVPNTLLTPKQVVSGKSLTPTLLESAFISVSATSYPSVTYMYTIWDLLQ